MPPFLIIDQHSNETRCTAPTIRHNEEIGLIPLPSRTAGNQRRYGPAHVTRLSFIEHCREIGFRQDAIRDLLELTKRPGQRCGAVTEIARTRLNGMNQRVAHLMALKLELEQMIDVCRGGRINDCWIIETLCDCS